MLWALSDLHLPGGTDKSMDRFGPAWVGHAARIRRAWIESVAPPDIVLVPGDLSWAMRPAEAEDDLAFLAALPGRKILSRGNHDYWWKSLAAVSAMLPPGVTALQNSAMDMEGFVLASARGWVLPSSPYFDASRDAQALEREVGRMRSSLEAAGAIQRRGRPLVMMMHFPPTEDLGPTVFTEMLASGGVDVCVFGHVHGEAEPGLEAFSLDGVSYRLVSADHAGFRPVRIDLPGEAGR